MPRRKFEAFHLNRSPFFEGVYFKIVAPDKRSVYAIIPGVAYTESGQDDHAFIQFFDGFKEKYHYLRFPIDDFSSLRKRFNISIAGNDFSTDHIKINLQNPNVEGELRFKDFHPWPGIGLSKRTMSLFEILPRMECYYSIMSFYHKIEGSLKIEDRVIDFTGGKGYMEKNWGSSFPEAWLWMNSNHFSQPDVSLTASLAIVPYLGFTLPGFIAGIMIGSRFYGFTTYNFSKVTYLDINENRMEMHYRSLRYQLEIVGELIGGVLMKAPKEGIMEGRCLESLKSELKVTLKRINRDGEPIIFQDTGKLAGLEINGDMDMLKTKLNLK